MIKFDQVTALQDAFIDLSRMIDYPDEDTFSPQVYDDLVANYPETAQKQRLLTVFEALSQGTALDQQSHFSELFEMNKRYPLYMSYYKMVDSRERGTLLAKLKMLYEMFGVSIDGSELADYLPMILEFFAYGSFDGDPRKQDLQLAFQVIEDGTFTMLQNAAAEIDDPYFQLIKVIREELRSCVETEVTAK
ncbi:nitrate reductase molybdenum cofactor assembly chaperone [Secundilactobacillus paracollinoides]|uniref:Nitrate reductase molybdenum cofactor assembly chaperone n=1 Tax=Secundilactobacillus paracollinoides TaxID=240427 RepID=A0A1B2IVJ0_9LACO|nr:nitrate reductase molybdenum cofactor assembly chaperone [Secundilactobacillus paracollinoides]ANZ62778.1 nitrate reductase molybdenum cofactor assembly chaperone [Secundilactobacillus paracollinoides]ANZ66063.1 nitrate reductase molybdenum cofactor assembly chaperone [Secundilactobacillus paracollinoides]